MDIAYLKEYILENDLITKVLEELNCHHIRKRDGFVQAANPDGDNQTAVCVYENTGLTTVNYTRDINDGKAADLITLVEYYKSISFPYAVKWLCDVLGLDYYKDEQEDLPESLRLTNLLIELSSSGSVADEEKPLKPINEANFTILRRYVNDMFYEDGVDYETQYFFEVGYDECSERITIPIRDEIGSLVGIKGRYFYREVPKGIDKFLYLIPCARSKILYGLDKTLPYIKEEGLVYVVEAEKGVMQLFSAGYKNSVATGGKKVSRQQIEKLTRLCVPVVFVFDKDVELEELKALANRFEPSVEVYALLDLNGILDKKESPTDDIKKFDKMVAENMIKLR